MSSGIRVSGMVSGLDTESLVTAMVATQTAKKEKLQKAQTKLQWKQDAFKSINTKVYGLYSKISNLRFSAAYNMKKTTVSDSTKATVTASSSAVNGTQKLTIEKLATSGYLTGAELKKGTTGSSTLADLGYTDGDTTLSVTVGTTKKDIEVSSTTTIDDLVSKLKDAGVNASYDETNRRIFVSAKETGKDNDFAITSSSKAGLNALNAAGLCVSSASDKENYKKMASYAKGTTAETSDAMLEILKKLKNAYDSNTELSLKEKNLSAKISYSNAKDAVKQFSDDNNSDEDSQLLLNLLKVSGSKYSRVDADGNVVEDYDNTSGLPTLNDKITELAKSKGLITETTDADGKTIEDTSKLDTLRSNVKAVVAVDDNGVYTDDDKAGFYLPEDERTAAEEELADIPNKRAANDTVIADENNSYWDIKDYTGMGDTELRALADKYADEIMNAKSVVDNNFKDIPVSTGATRVDAEDAKITLNDAEFTSSSNVFSINGLTIKATGTTAAGEALTINTDTDTQGLYDKIKDFLTEYNTVINELSSLYNADSAKGYEPLTDDEKSEMSDSEVEKWETKIKDAILRNDSTISGVMNAMTTSMMKTYTINGKTYSLANMGIHTLGYLNAAKNEQYAYHIDGDEDDSNTSGNTDKLLDMLTNNPEDVEEFMKQLTSGLYTALDNKMKSTNLSSAYTIYNDKQMTKDYSSYTTQIKNWETKIEDLETRYYKQFSNMETQLAKMQSSTSSLSSLFGN
ncbi:MAG: flagellar filament capping protein FliD [Lachnobacterium sp.]|nr:flagellar filament capping protein FliD [Lachnobacterium sp.]